MQKEEKKVNKPSKSMIPRGKHAFECGGTLFLTEF